MEAADLATDGRIFKADFTDSGAYQLRERMREKLREFKGSAEVADYVIVLLRNGKREDEARKELRIFLGVDDSALFISWLWDHLSLNLHLYVQTQEQAVENKDDEIPKELSGRHKSPEVHTRRDQTPLEHTSESNATTRSRNKRDWKGTGREGNRNFPLRSVLTDILHGEEKKLQKSTEIRQPPSSNQRNGRKRDREDEPQQTKRELPSRPVLGASRRLLQFAVRDAVKAVQQTSSSTEPSSKRLRSVVNTLSTDNLHGKISQRSTDSLHDSRSERATDSLHDRRSERSADNPNDKRVERKRQILQVPGAALALRAAAEPKSECWKGPWYDGAAGGREPHIMRSLINLTDRTEHQRRRKTWDAAFSAKALKGYEGALVNNMEIMLRQLAKRANADEAVDIDDWGMFFAFDMISEVGFGRNLGLLEQGKLSPILEQLEDLMKFQQVVNNRPYMIEVTRHIPTPKGAYAGMVMELLEQRDKDAHGQKADIMQFLYEASAEEESTDKTDSTTYDKYNMRNNHGRRAELAAEARLIIVAGSDTSSTVMAMTLFLLLQHPEVTAQLRAELDRVFGTDYETAVSDFTRLDRECALLNAVINESMRLFPPLAGGLQKVNTRGSTVVPLLSGSKMVVPKDVVITIPTWTMQRDARNFSPEPNAFRPERWLQPDKEERFDRRAFVPFSAGATVCVGKLLAYMELRLVIANLVRRFDMRATSDFDPVAFEDGLRDVFVSTRLKKLSVRLADRSSGASQAAAAV